MSRDPRKDRARKRRLRRREQARTRLAEEERLWWLDWERARYGQLRPHWGESRRIVSGWADAHPDGIPF